MYRRDCMEMSKKGLQTDSFRFVHRSLMQFQQPSRISKAK